VCTDDVFKGALEPYQQR